MVGVKLAYYKKKDWNRFLKMIDDREGMYDRWHEWHKAFEKMKLDLEKQGISVVTITVNLDDLAAYCQRQGKKIDGATRAQFVQSR